VSCFLTTALSDKVEQTQNPQWNNSRQTGSRSLPSSNYSVTLHHYFGPRQRWSAFIPSRNQFWRKVVMAPIFGTRITAAAEDERLQARIDVHSSC